MIVEQVKNRDRLLEVMYEGHFRPRASNGTFLDYFPYGKVLREFQNGDQEGNAPNGTFSFFAS